MIFGPIIGIFGCTVLFLSLHSIFAEMRLNNYGQQTRAKILSMGSKSDRKTGKGQTCQIDGQYSVNDIEYINKYHIPPKEYIHLRVGQTVNIVYDPINPINTESQFSSRDGCLFWCQIIFCSMCIGIGLSIIIFIVSPIVLLDNVDNNETEAILLAFSIGFYISFPICLLRCYKGGYLCCGGR